MRSINTTKRLSANQVSMLDMLAHFPDFTYVTGLPTLRTLAAKGLVEMKPRNERQWRITHDGLCVLKQNGYYPVHIDRTSVRDPRTTASSAI